MNIMEILRDDLIALNRLVVSGTDNCLIVGAIGNDLKRVIAELNNKTQNGNKNGDKNEELKEE